MNQHRLPILADFLFLHNLLSEKNIEHQSFEATSSHVQKKFPRNEFLCVSTLLSLLIRYLGHTLLLFRVDLTDKFEFIGTTTYRRSQTDSWLTTWFMTYSEVTMSQIYLQRNRLSLTSYISSSRQRIPSSKSHQLRGISYYSFCQAEPRMYAHFSFQLCSDAK